MKILCEEVMTTAATLIGAAFGLENLGLEIFFIDETVSLR